MERYYSSTGGTLGLLVRCSMIFSSVSFTRRPALKVRHPTVPQTALFGSLGDSDGCLSKRFVIPTT